MAQWALEFIGEAEKPQTVKTLLKAAKTGNWHTRRIIERSIGRLSKPQDVNLAVETLLDKTRIEMYVRRPQHYWHVFGDVRVVDCLLVCLPKKQSLSLP